MNKLVENNLEKYLKKMVRDRSISPFSRHQQQPSSVNQRPHTRPSSSFPPRRLQLMNNRAGAFHALAFDTCNTRVVVGTFVFEKSRSPRRRWTPLSLSLSRLCDTNVFILANIESLRETCSSWPPSLFNKNYHSRRF